MLNAAAEVLAEDEIEAAVRLVLRNCNYDGDKSLQRVMARHNVALLDAVRASEIASDCIGSVDYGLPRIGQAGSGKRGLSWVERIRVAIEVLSRIVLRVDTAKAEEVYRFALRCYQQPAFASDMWLFEPLRHLISRSWEALIPCQRARLAVSTLAAPIAVSMVSHRA